MGNRVLAVFRAGFEAQWSRGSWPVAPLIMHASLAAVVCGLAGDLPPFAYALLAFSVSGALLVLPLLGEFGASLRSDPAQAWVEALPVRAVELRIARTLLLLLLVGALTLASLVPAACFAPATMGVLARVELVAAGLGLALFACAFLLGVQSLLGERAEALLVLFQTALMAATIVGFVVGVRFVQHMRAWDSPATSGVELALYPPAWFAALFTAARDPSGHGGQSAWWSAAALLATLAALAVLLAAPFPPPSRARHSGGVLALLLRPARALATRVWVQRDERASFDLVFDALPLEREFVLRTYPLFGIPLAFLLVGARGEPGPVHDGLLALLLFTPAIYLPVLIAHVPATASPGARWLLDTAPVSSAAIDNGALKAVAVRFLLPLYALLFALCATQGGLGLALRLAPIGALVSLLALRKLYAQCVGGPPLSIAAADITARLDWTGSLMGLALALTVLAVLAASYVSTIPIAVVIMLVLLVFEWLLDRRLRVATAHDEAR